MLQANVNYTGIDGGRFSDVHYCSVLSLAFQIHSDSLPCGHLGIQWNSSKEDGRPKCSSGAVHTDYHNQSVVV